MNCSKSPTATIHGREWDTPIMGACTVDAVHRSVLLRFPDAADTIAILLRRGRILRKAELSLQCDGYEILPIGYTCREGLGRKLWTANPPTWHVHAWPLRQPWIADKAPIRYAARWWATVRCPTSRPSALPRATASCSAPTARSFTISGLAEPPRVTLNGRPADVRVAGQAFQISLA